MPWFFIQERCVIASRSVRPNHWVERSLSRFLVMSLRNANRARDAFTPGSGTDALPRLLIEQMHGPLLNAQPDPVAGIHLRAAVSDQRDLCRAGLHEQLRLGAGRLDHD